MSVAESKLPSVTEFTNDSSAVRSMRSRKINARILSNRDRDIFLDMLENPAEPTKALLEAVAEYKQRVISR